MENTNKTKIISEIINAYRTTFGLKTDLVVIPQMLEKSEDSTIEQIYALSKSHDIKDKVKYSKMIADEVVKRKTSD